jgi:hypothetical protein
LGGFLIVKNNMKKEKQPKLGSLLIALGVNAIPNRRAEKSRLFNSLCSGLEVPKPRVNQPKK